MTLHKMLTRTWDGSMAPTLRPRRRAPACTTSSCATTTDSCHSPRWSVQVRASRPTMRSVFSRTTTAGPPVTSLAHTVQWLAASSHPSALENSHVRCTCVYLPLVLPSSSLPQIYGW
eukprot:2171365-Amphidinium_carterae.2